MAANEVMSSGEIAEDASWLRTVVVKLLLMRLRLLCSVAQWLRSWLGFQC